MAPPKKGLALLLSGKPEGDDEMTEEGEDMGSDSLVFAEDLLAAIKADDAQAVDDALKAHYEACRSAE